MDVFGLECRVIPDPDLRRAARPPDRADADRPPRSHPSPRPPEARPSSMNRRSLALLVAAASLVVAACAGAPSSPSVPAAATAAASPSAAPSIVRPRRRRAAAVAVARHHHLPAHDPAQARLHDHRQGSRSGSSPWVSSSRTRCSRSGVTPVGTTEWFGEHPGAVWPWAADLLTGKPPTVVGDATAVNFEQIAALKPDLILGLYSGLDQGAVRPAAPASPLPSPSRRRTSTTASRGRSSPARSAQIVAKPGEADALVRTSRTSSSAVQAAHPKFVGASSVVATPYEGVYVYGPEDVRGRLLEAPRLQASRGSGRGHRRGLRRQPQPRARRHARRRRDRRGSTPADAEGDLGGPLYDSLKVHTEGREVHPRLLRRPARGCDLLRDRAQPAVPAGRHRPEAGGGDRRRPGDGGAVTGISAAPAVMARSAETRSAAPLDETFARLRAATPYVDGRVGVPDAPAPAIDIDLLLERGRRRWGDRANQRYGRCSPPRSVFYRVCPLGAYSRSTRPCLEPVQRWTGTGESRRLTTCGSFTALPGDRRATCARSHDDDALAQHPSRTVQRRAAVEHRRGAARGSRPVAQRSDTIAGGMLWLGECRAGDWRPRGGADVRDPVATRVATRRVRLQRDSDQTVHSALVLPLVAARRRHLARLPGARRAARERLISSAWRGRREPVLPSTAATRA